MAGLTVRDPAVDRSLRSVFGERNSVEPSIGEGQKKTGIGEQCPPAPHKSPRELVMGRACSSTCLSRGVASLVDSWAK